MPDFSFAGKKLVRSVKLGQLTLVSRLAGWVLLNSFFHRHSRATLNVQFSCFAPDCCLNLGNIGLTVTRSWEQWHFVRIFIYCILVLILGNIGVTNCVTNCGVTKNIGVLDQTLGAVAFCQD